MANFRFWNAAKTFWKDIDVGEPTSNQTYTLPAIGQQLSGVNDVTERLFGVKNYIINGGFDRWDYATSQTTNAYGSDNRWFNSNIGSSKTHSQVACTDIERALFNATYFSRTSVSSVVGTGNYAGKNQRIENVTKLAGKTVTLSFLAKADTAKNIAIDFMQAFGTGGTPSAYVEGIGAQLVPLTATWQKFSITVQIPSIIGKTLGTDGVHTSFLMLYFWFDAGSDYSARTANLGQQSGTFDIAQVQLEEGSIATPWSPYFGEFGGEAQACQRYYELFDIGTGGGASNKYVGGAGVSYWNSTNNFKALKRIVPTIVHPTITYTNCSSLSNVVTTDSVITRVSTTAAGAYSATASGILSSASAEL